MDKKVYKNIIKYIVLIICILLIGILLYFNTPIKKAERNLSKINDESEIDGSSSYPINLYLSFENYTGDIEIVNVGKDFEYYFNKIIPTYYKKCKNMSTEELTDYFEKNEKVIIKELGIDNLNDFQKVLFEITKIDAEKLKLSSYEIIDGTIIFKNNKAFGCIKAIYNDTKELYLNYEVKNDNFSYEHPVKLSGDVNIEKVKEQEVENMKKEEEEQFNQTGKVFN